MDLSTTIQIETIQSMEGVVVVAGVELGLIALI